MSTSTASQGLVGISLCSWSTAGYALPGAPFMMPGVSSSESRLHTLHSLGHDWQIALQAFFQQASKQWVRLVLRISKSCAMHSKSIKNCLDRAGLCLANMLLPLLAFIIYRNVFAQHPTSNSLLGLPGLPEVTCREHLQQVWSMAHSTDAAADLGMTQVFHIGGKSCCALDCEVNISEKAKTRRPMYVSMEL